VQVCGQRMGKHIIATVAQISPGGRKLVELEGRPIVRISLLPHEEIVRCPRHAWELDIRTGKSWCDPRRIRVKNYPVGVELGARLVEGPYAAETFRVSVQENYVIVQI